MSPGPVTADRGDKERADGKESLGSPLPSCLSRAEPGRPNTSLNTFLQKSTSLPRRKASPIHPGARQRHTRGLGPRPLPGTRAIADGELITSERLWQHGCGDTCGQKPGPSPTSATSSRWLRESRVRKALGASVSPTTKRGLEALPGEAAGCRRPCSSPSSLARWDVPRPPAALVPEARPLPADPGLPPRARPAGGVPGQCLDSLPGPASAPAAAPSGVTWAAEPGLVQAKVSVMSQICPPLVLGSEVNSGQLGDRSHTQELPYTVQGTGRLENIQVTHPQLHTEVQMGRGAGSQAPPARLCRCCRYGAASLLCHLDHTADPVSQALYLTQRAHEITLTWPCCGHLSGPLVRGLFCLEMGEGLKL